MPPAPPVGQAFSPLDEELALGAATLSPRLLEGIVRLGTWMPFERVPAALTFFTGVPSSSETARRLTEAAGAALVAAETAAVERLERELPPVPAGPALQQLSVDGAMVPLVGGRWAEVKTVAIGTVVTPAGPDGATVPHATELSYFSRLASAEEFGRLALVELHRRGTATAERVGAVADGACWCQGFVDLHRPDAVRILDFPHPLEHLAQAAQAGLGKGTAATACWLETQRHTLRHGELVDVLQALCALPTTTAPDPQAAVDTRDAVLAYLARRWEELQYPVFAAAGYPLGSGIVESANKLVVEARLKGSGMHWAPANVNPLVALRAVACSDRWAAVWPTVWRGLRQQTATCRRERHQRRRTAAAPVSVVPAPPSLPAPAAVTEPPAPAAVPEKLVMNGRPTAAHPWRKFRLRGSRPAASAKA